MTIVEAITQVMREAGRPLTAKEAYDAIVAGQLYDFHAKDPGHVVLMQIRRHCEGLDFPSAAPTKHFQLHGDNHYAPLATPVRTIGKRRRTRRSRTRSARPAAPRESSLTRAEQDLWQMHERYLGLFRQRMLAELKKLEPAGFEAFAGELLDAYGFEDTHVTNVSGDGGIDGYGKLKVGLAHLNVAFQCKRWTKGNIQRPEIDKFRGATQGEYEQGIFFTTSSFSTGAVEVSMKKGAIPIVLIDGPAIVKLMIEKKLRVESTTMDIPALAV
jgi:restriction system protein